MNKRLRKYVETKLNHIKKMPRVDETFFIRLPERQSGQHMKWVIMKKAEKFLMNGIMIGITSL